MPSPSLRLSDLLRYGAPQESQGLALRDLLTAAATAEQGKAAMRNPTPEWMKPENASVLDPWYTKAARAIGHVIGADDPNSQVMALLNPMEAGKKAPIKVKPHAQVFALEKRASEYENNILKPLMTAEQQAWDALPKQGGISHNGEGWYGYETGFDHRDPNAMNVIHNVQQRIREESDYVSQLRKEAAELRANLGAEAMIRRGEGAAAREILPTKERTFGDLLSSAGATKEKPPIKAYHGSPHDFDQFSMSKIGTGEGAQAYGHGLYFAENEKVAKAYRDDLGLKVPSIGGKPTSNAADSMAHTILSRLPKGATVDDAIRMVDKWAEAGVFKGQNEANSVLNVKRAIGDSFGKELGESVQGKMYEVNIHADPDDFLDWDAPLSQQPKPAQELVREGLKKAGFLGPNDNGPRQLASAMRAWKMQYGGMSESQMGALLSGRGGILGDKPEALAEGLKAQGIPGIKYLDGMSRGKGKGSRNYVVFDDKLVSIVKKFGIAGALSAGLINEAQARQMQEQGLQ